MFFMVLLQHVYLQPFILSERLIQIRNFLLLLLLVAIIEIMLIAVVDGEVLPLVLQFS